MDELEGKYLLGKPTLYGAPYSVYVRSARLALEEKGVAYHLEPVDVFAENGVPDWYLALNPFGKIPTLCHENAVLFETSAILRYIDEAFEGVRLQPRDPRRRARMNQVLSILDNYVYPHLVWDIYVERIVNARNGTADELKIAAAIPVVSHALTSISAILSNGPWLLGGQISLADLHAATMLSLASNAPECKMLLLEHPTLEDWLARMEARPSMQRTAERAD